MSIGLVAYGEEVPLITSKIRREGEYVKSEAFAGLGQEEKYEYIKDQIDKCKNGDAIFNGRGYFWYHFVCIKALNGGIIRPSLRATDILWFKIKQRVYDNSSGLLAIKRRRQGATWRSASDDIYDVLFSRATSIGYSSDGEEKSFEYMLRCQFIYDKLPPFLRPGYLNKSKRLFRIGKKVSDERGQKKEEGNLSEIIVKAPINDAWEGGMYRRVTQDEIGKVDAINLITWLDMTMPCFFGEDGFTRVGHPVMFGVIGEMEGGPGEAVTELWNECEGRNIEQLFIPGTWGIKVDEYGNEDLEAATQAILEERKKIKNKKSLISHKQQYPLTIEDAFIKDSDQYFFPIEILESINFNINSKKPAVSTGFMQKTDTGVSFIPSHKGCIEILEHPVHALKDVRQAYVQGVDPIDHDGANKKQPRYTAFKKEGAKRERSGFGSLVYKRIAEIGGIARLPVALMLYRPSNVTDAYRQAIMLSHYYSSKINVEQNRFSFISFCKEWRETDVLAVGSSEIARLINGSTYKYGYNKGPAEQNLIDELIEADIRENSSKILFQRLYEELLVYGRKNTDLVDAYGGALLLDKHYSVIEAKRSSSEITKSRTKLPKLKLTPNGLIRVRE